MVHPLDTVGRPGRNPQPGLSRFCSAATTWGLACAPKAPPRRPESGRYCIDAELAQAITNGPEHAAATAAQAEKPANCAAPRAVTLCRWFDRHCGESRLAVTAGAPDEGCGQGRKEPAIAAGSAIPRSFHLHMRPRCRMHILAEPRQKRCLKAVPHGLWRPSIPPWRRLLGQAAACAYPPVSSNTKGSISNAFTAHRVGVCQHVIATATAQRTASGLVSASTNGSISNV